MKSGNSREHHFTAVASRAGGGDEITGKLRTCGPFFFDVGQTLIDEVLPDSISGSSNVHADVVAREMKTMDFVGNHVDEIVVTRKNMRKIGASNLEKSLAVLLDEHLEEWTLAALACGLPSGVPIEVNRTNGQIKRFTGNEVLGVSATVEGFGHHLVEHANGNSEESDDGGVT